MQYNTVKLTGKQAITQTRDASIYGMVVVVSYLVLAHKECLTGTLWVGGLLQQQRVFCRNSMVARFRATTSLTAPDDGNKL